MNDGPQIDIDVTDSKIETKGTESAGIVAIVANQGGGGGINIGVGNVDLDLTNTEIITHSNGESSYGIYVRSNGSQGKIDIDITGGSITTKGIAALGIYAEHEDDTNTDDLTINLVDHDIRTEGTGIYSGLPSLPGTYAYGIFAVQRNSGDISIDMQQGLLRDDERAELPRRRRPITLVLQPRGAWTSRWTGL